MRELESPLYLIPSYNNVCSINFNVVQPDSDIGEVDQSKQWGLHGMGNEMVVAI